MNMKITKIFEFDSAHNLINYNGKCEKLHGHTYRLEVTVSGVPDINGLVIDFTLLKSIVNECIIEKLDHQYLNELFDFNTTCENLLVWMWNELYPKLKTDRFELYQLTLWETPTSYATLTKEDMGDVEDQ